MDDEIMADGGVRRRTAGEARADKSRDRKENVVTATIARRALLRDETGLWADFPNQNGDRSKGPVPLHFLLEMDTELGAALAEGYAMHCLKNVNSADRRYDLGQALRRGLLTWLNECDVATSTTLADVDEALLHRFKRWLDDAGRDGFIANQMTRAMLLSAVQLPLAQLLKSNEWKPRLSSRLQLIAKPYPKMSRSVEHTAVLEEEDYERLYAGAALDIAETMRLRRAQFARMAAFDGNTLTIAEAGRSPEACAAWLDANFTHPVPSRYEQGRLNAAYLRFIPEAIQAAAEQILYPDFDEIVPMLLVICTFFALNPSSAFKLRKGGRDYRISNLGGIRRLRMYPQKKRASFRQRNVVTVTKHPDNPGTILEYLEKRTRRLGKMRPEIADRVFVRFSFEYRRAVPLLLSDKAWRKALKRFADRHGIPEFTIEQLRPSTLDLIHELSGGNIIAMQGVATHTSTQTTYTYYTSDAQRRRNREKLGEVLLQMQRWVVMGGKIRPEDLPPGVAEHAAATPGFACLDPKDSPIEGERPGELCTAYGRCPECPLAIVDPTSPRSLAYLMMLNKRITEAADRLDDPIAWHMRWAPVQEELLTYWLRGWSPEMVDKARAIPIPELPAVE